MLSASSIIAVWLFYNPGIKITDKGGTVYWFSKADNCFMYQNPNNKVRNKPMKARFLCISFFDYVRNYDHAFDYICEESFFNMK